MSLLRKILSVIFIFVLTGISYLEGLSSGFNAQKYNIEKLELQVGTLEEKVKFKSFVIKQCINSHYDKTGVPLELHLEKYFEQKPDPNEYFKNKHPEFIRTEEFNGPVI